jgi:multidrug resistance protein, MATE family
MGNFRSLLRLFFPIFLATGCNVVYPILEKLLLARLSPEAMGIGISAAYAVQIFQSPFVAVAMMCQVFVGRWQGSGDLKAIGPGVWQFLWFSILSAFIIVPCGLLYGKFYFTGMNLGEATFSYYSFLIYISFLYPLGATLFCFFLGLGNTRTVLWITLGSQVLHVFLCYVLISGWEGVIPSYGLMGGPLSSLITQALYCLLMGLIFLQKKYRILYHSNDWFFKPFLFVECLSPGALRGVNRFLCFTSWASIAYLMSSKGETYLLILSVGGTLFLFVPCLIEAICEAQITIVSQLLGSQNYSLLNKAFNSAFLLVILIVAAFSIPFLVFPADVFTLLFPGAVMSQSAIQTIFFGVWVSFAFFLFSFIPISYVLAFKDTRFSLFMGFVNWINGFLLMYLLIDKVSIAPEMFWLALSLMHGSNALLYLWRMRWLQASVMELSFTSRPMEVPFMPSNEA